MMDYNSVIGKNIRYLRNRNSMTQKELGDKLGCSSKVVSKWENEKEDETPCEPSFENSCKMADLFKVSLDDLIRKDCSKLDEHRTEMKIKQMGDSIADLVINALSGDADIWNYMIKKNPKILEQLDHVLLEKELSKKFFSLGEEYEAGGDNPPDFESYDDGYLDMRIRNYSEARRFYRSAVDLGDESAAWKVISILRRECEVEKLRISELCAQYGEDEESEHYRWMTCEEEYKGEIRQMKILILDKFRDTPGWEVIDELDEYWGEKD